MDKALIIFIKNLEKGKVKTRLASTIGHDKAMEIYKALLNHTRDISIELKVDRLLFYSQFIVENDDWKASVFNKLVQEGTELGDKMSNAFAEAFKNHEKVVIIGSDCASLNTKILEEAFQLLNEYPFVIGPATDGGYYLLGMNQYTPSLFTNIEWSTDQVFPKTIEVIESLGQSYALLPELSDIDYEEDWKKSGWKL